MINPLHSLSRNFDYFFKRLNPSSTWKQKASSQHTTITELIETSPLTNELKPKCFLQGSYDRQTSIYTINDIDIVALCQTLTFGQNTNTYSTNSKSWSRDEIFKIIAAPLLNDGRYKDKVKYNTGSMCIKVNLGINVEILPVVYKFPNNNIDIEPFCLYRPEKQQWEDGLARAHQQKLTKKNRVTENFIPAIKVFKHLRNYHDVEAISFHIECLLYCINNQFYQGNSATYITNLLDIIAQYSANEWYNTKILTPCGERYLFTDNEWSFANWKIFHRYVQVWSIMAIKATQSFLKDDAIKCWQELLGKEYFPKEVNS